MIMCNKCGSVDGGQRIFESQRSPPSLSSTPSGTDYRDRIIKHIKLIKIKRISMTPPYYTRSTRSVRSLRVRNSASPDFDTTPTKAPFNDLYDVSDQEENKTETLLVNLGNKKIGQYDGAPAKRQSHGYAKPKQSLQGKKNRSRISNVGAKTKVSNSLLSSSPGAQETGRGPPRRNRSDAKMQKERSNISDTDSAKLSTKAITLTSSKLQTVCSETPRRRGSRRPNTVPSSRKSLRQKSHRDNEDDNLDFRAEDIDASTPLNNVKVNEIVNSSSLSAKKRKHSELQIPQSSPTIPSSVELAVINPDETIPNTNPYGESESGDENESSTNDERARNPRVNRQSTPSDTLSAIMAPPQSSSSLASSPLVSSSNPRSLRARTPLVRTNYLSDLSSPPSLTHSPDLPLEIHMSPRLSDSLPSNFSTAQLQALLPKRRKRGVHDMIIHSMGPETEINVSNIASDDDELTYMPTNIRDPGNQQVSAASKGKLNTQRKISGSTKKKSAPIKKHCTGKKKVLENEDEIHPEENFEPLTNDENISENSQELEQRLGQELKMAARKFQEIDKWQLDFEEVSVSDLSSPNDAR